MKKHANFRIFIFFATFLGSLLQSKAIFSQTAGNNTPNTNETMIVRIDKFYSKYLKRHVVIDVFLPPNYHQETANYPVLYANDGQDMVAVEMEKTLNKLYEGKEFPKILVIAVHTSSERLQEYGTSAMPDYKGRGSKAGKYTKFVMDELTPYIHQTYRVKKDANNTAFMGFSLGGLSAFDITWNHPYAFSKVGVFSGSFWWRKKAYEDGYDDENDRIMHNLIKQSSYKKGLKMWFEVGTKDETDDRNKNGIIDAIDDTLDIITELEKKGYKKETDMRYVCIEGGEHNQKTWAGCLPDFLTWAFAK
jgi:enterochelin esterase-like enzyme